MTYSLITIGASFGGTLALKTILQELPENFPLPIAIVLHLGSDSKNTLPFYLNNYCQIEVKEAAEKELLRPGIAYFAPADYHILVEDDMRVSFSVEEKVKFSRPSIDVLFETAAFALPQKVVGIVLTGASSDGSYGLMRIHESGGLTIVQDPTTAEATAMPEHAIAATKVDHILPLSKIAPFLINLFC